MAGRRSRPAAPRSSRRRRTSQPCTHPTSHCAMTPAIDAVFTMCPSPRSRIPGPNVWTPLNVPVSLIATSPVERRRWHRRERIEVWSDPRVVHQDLDRAEPALDVVADRPPAVPVGDVEAVDDHGRAEPRMCGRKRGFVEVEHRDPRTGSHQRLGDREPDTAGRSVTTAVRPSIRSIAINPIRVGAATTTGPTAWPVPARDRPFARCR